MQKSGLEYDIEEKDAVIQIATDPDKNDVAQRNIEAAMGRGETCINSAPGRFSVIQTDIRVYKSQKEEELES